MTTMIMRSRKFLVVFIFCFLVLSVAGPVRATDIYSQNFNNLSNGDLNGQDNWSGDTNFDVQTSVKYEGAKAVGVVGAVSWTTIKKNFVQITEKGTLKVALRGHKSSSGNSTVPIVQLRDSGNATAVQFRLGLETDNEITLNNIFIQGALEDTWYFGEIEFDISTQKERIRINGGSWSELIDFLSPVTEISSVFLGIDQTGSGASGYFDTLEITTTPQPAQLTVIKNVINDNGGAKTVSDFPLFVGGTPVVSGVQNTFNPGTYTVSETADPAYQATFTGDCAADGSITLASGDVKTCVITNDDVVPPGVACMQAAIEKRDTAIITAFDNYSSTVKNLLTIRKDELKAAWALTNKTARRTAIKAAWQKYSNGLKKAREEIKKAKKSAWKQFHIDERACRVSAGDDGVGEGVDSRL
jgi:hypothetical protein